MESYTDWIYGLTKKFKKETNKENRCPNCNYLLSKNLKGQVEIRCRKCKQIIKLNEK